jgi:rod shape-determining protein MreD
MRRTLIFFLTQFLLWVLLSQVNHELTPWGIALFFGGLFVGFSALHFERREALVGAFAAGFLHDVGTPLPFGTHAVVFAAAVIFLQHVRHRLNRHEGLITVMVILIANLGLFLAVSAVAARLLPDVGGFTSRVFSDLIASQLTLALVAPWFLALQSKTLEIAGLSAPAEPRPRSYP